MKKLYFIRHGLSKMNQDGFLAGLTETPLTDIGREQARAAGEAAKALGLDAIVSSPLERAFETACIIAKAIGYPTETIYVSELVLERDFGEAEGTPYSPDANMDNPTIETFEQVMERARLTLSWLENVEADNILIVSHGAFGRAIRTVIHPEIDPRLQIDNGEILQLI